MITVTLPTSLWDTVVDSLGADYGIGRSDPRWSYRKVGFGGRYSIEVEPDIAERIGHYLDTTAGLASQTWAMDAMYRDESRREARAASKAAQAIRSQLDTRDDPTDNQV